MHVIEIGNGLVTFQLRGLEFRGEGGDGGDLGDGRGGEGGRGGREGENVLEKKKVRKTKTKR